MASKCRPETALPRGAFASVPRCVGIRSPLPPPPTGLGVGPELLDWQQAEPPIRGPPPTLVSPLILMAYLGGPPRFL